jgi:hypothetical protein
VTRNSLSTTAAVLTATAALLLTLTACGGDSEPSDAIASASGPPPSSASASPSASALSGSGAPTFDLPDDIKVDFEGFTNSDATTNAVLVDTSHAMTATLEALASGEGASANVKRYWTGLPGAQLSDWIIGIHRKGTTITGTYHYYRPTVKPTSKTTVAVTFCEDQRKAFAKVIQTGEVKTTTPSLKDFNLWSLSMAKGTAGEWQVFRYVRTDEAKQCQIG